MKRKKAAIITFGCQMNKYDSEVIEGVLDDEGYEATGKLAEADFILINTCSIRDKAEQKLYSQLGRLKELKSANPELLIAVSGCVAQVQGSAIVDRAPYVDIVFGTRNIQRLSSLLAEHRLNGASVADVTPTLPEDADYDLPVKRTSDLQAWVTVMTGCDHRCTFCVVPMTRGPENSLPSAEIIRQVRQLAAEGYKEVTLLGQTVNSYKADIDFPNLLGAVNEVDGIARIRFITSHPKDVSAQLIEQMATLPKVCEHLHLPVQAGSDRILEAMARGYTAEHYRATVAALRKAMPDLSLTSDVIVAFPGETEEDFHATLELLEAVKFDSIFLFKYSPRPGTQAAEMANQIPKEVTQERFQRALDLQASISKRRNESLVGRTVEVLVEGESKRDATMLTGRTPSNKLVHFPVKTGLAVGDLAEITITRAKLHSLEGELALN